RAHRLSLPTRRSSDLRYQAQTSWSGQAAQSGLRAVQMRAPNSITPAFHCTWSRSGTNPAAQAVSFRPGDAVGRSLPAKRRMRTRRTFRSEEHTSELQSRFDLVCRLLLD